LPIASKKAQKLAASLARSLDFKSDSLSSEATVELIGNREVKIYSCRSISDFSSSLVTVNCSALRICIRGSDLVISDFVGGSVTVTGDICGIFFDGGAECLVD